MVVGIEADFDWFANNNNSSGGVNVGNTTLQGSSNGRWLTTVTGRLGFAIDRVLFYAKGGGAWVGSNNLTLLDVASGQTVSFSNNNTNSGWTAGAGVEWAFADNWSVRAEYDYVGLSNDSFTVPSNSRSRLPKVACWRHLLHEQSQHLVADRGDQLSVPLS